MSKTAIIAGSTGLIGSKLLEQLLANTYYSEVKIVVRRPTGIVHQKLKEYVVDFDKLSNHSQLFEGDVFFSCLGSTKNKTPDKTDYFKIDHDYPLAMAKICLQNEVPEIHLISAVGAKASSANFYISMKGKIERDIAVLPFRAVHIYRPSMLTGDRKEKRTMEKIAIGVFKVINPLLIGALKKYRSINVADVAKTMATQSLKSLTGVHFYESDEIQRIADDK